MALASSASAATLFSTGNPDGLMGTASRPSTPGKIEIESADDFAINLPSPTRIDGATFTGILNNGATIANITQVVVELYRIFPLDSNTVRLPIVPTRANSPSDVEFDSRDSGASGAGGLSFTTTILNGGNAFSVNNSVINVPTAPPFTGGNGQQQGTEVQFNVTFSTPFNLVAGEHDFFVPQVALSGANQDFLWLSAPRPIVAPGTPFPAGITDLQSWIRNANLDPDWLRIGTDITLSGPFNGTFSLIGAAVPEPQSLILLGVGILGILGYSRAQRRRHAA
jgi:hypothetical protein